jgi:SAM-dependent methyltransferase
MTFSKEWEQLYRANTHMSIWPWSDLVSYVHRYARPEDGFHRVLELGCGAGANIPFFVKLGADYCGIDVSSEIVALLHKSFPQLKDKIVVGDFTKAPPFGGPFDLVVDRSSVTHNTTAAIQTTLITIMRQLRKGGRFIGIDWFSTAYPDAKMGDTLDSHTRTNIPLGQFKGLGTVHFSDQAHILNLLTDVGFQVERLAHKKIDCVIPGETPMGWWNFVAIKP